MPGQALTLRPYQLSAITDLRTAYRNAARAPLLVLPTGGGKTVIFSFIAQNAVARGSKVLILVHRRELIYQSSDTLGSLGLDHGVIAAGMKLSDAPVQIASVQTLVRRLDRIDWSPDLIVIDEAHHAVAGSWAKILAHYSNAKLLGVTATPKRLDGRGLGDFFDFMVVGPSISELTKDGHLAPSRCYTIPKKLNWRKMRQSGGEFVASEAERLIEDLELNGDAVREYQRHCPGKPAIVFCVNIHHSEVVAELFRQAGYRAEHLSCKLDHETRKQHIASLGNGNLDILTSCNVISEGTDIPVVNAAILLRPTKSESLYLQQVGRALRPAPGKEKALIIDCVGNILEHGMPDMVRLHTLEDQPKKESAPPVRECPVCYAVLPITATVCPSCGHIFTKEDHETADGQAAIKVRLVEIKKSQQAEQRDRRRRVSMARTFEELEKLRIEYGYKPGWTYKIMQQRSIKRPAPKRSTGMNWSEILSRANVPDSPGYAEAAKLTTDT